MERPSAPPAEGAFQVPEPAPRTAWLTPGRRLLLLAGAVLAILLYFAFTAFQGSAVYYLTVSEALAQRPGLEGRTVRINGRLVPDSFRRDPDTALARFVLVDQVGEPQGLTVAYPGSVPDLFFNPQSQIVVEGTFGPDGVFRAEQILVKCPSKYSAESPGTG